MALPNALQQLAALKTMTITTGAIHEAQALQIRNYPLMIPGVSSASAELDCERKILTYRCQIRPRKGCLPACKAISNFIRKYILWDDTTVIIKSNKRVIYDSRTE